MEAHLTGVFPRSEQLVEATRAAERGKISQAEVDAILDHDIAELGELQHLANLDSCVDGQLNWQDLLRPFSELFTGIRLGSLTRWFDNNTFYRQPVIVDNIAVGEVDPHRFFRSRLMPAQVRKKAILPGPFTFAVLSHNSAYPSLADLVDGLAHALKSVVRDLGNAGYSLVQFNEPALLVEGRTKQDFELAKNAFDTCARGFSGATLLQTYFMNVGPVIDDLLDYPVNGIGLDFYATPIDSLAECDFNKELGCGCIDGRNSLLENAQDLRDFIAKVNNVVNPKGLVLCPNCDLDFLPRAVAEKKVRVLAEAKSGVAA